MTSPAAFDASVAEPADASESGGAMPAGAGASPGKPASGAPACASPLQMRAAAYLYGVESVPLERARVLELGCAAGANLLPLALAYPEAYVVGLDTSEEQIERGRRAARELGVCNLHLHCMSALDVTPDFGEFDYIVLPNAYGRVPAEVGQALLGICRQNLAPRGLALVSYPTLPGWRMADVVRDAMLMRAHGAQTDAERIAEARSMLGLLKAGGQGNALSGAMAPIVEHAGALSDEDLAAEFLMGGAAPGYFLEFVDNAAQTGLAYVGDVEPEQEIPLAFGNQVSLTHSLMSLGQPKAMRQQYLDFAVGRSMRRSMLVHQERAQECRIAPDLGRLEQLRLAGSYTWQRKTGRDGVREARGSYTSHTGRTLASADTCLMAVMEALARAWPRTLSFDEVLAELYEAVYEDAQALRKSVAQALESLLRAGMLRYCREPAPHERGTHEHVAAVPSLAHACSASATADELACTNVWQDSVTVRCEPGDRDIVARLDGRTSLRQIIDGSGGGHAAALRVCRLLERLRLAGCLTGSDRAWSDYFRTQLWHHNEAGDEAGLGFAAALLSCELRMAAAGCKPPAGSSAEARELSRLQDLDKQNQHAAAEQGARALIERFPESGGPWLALARSLTRQERGDEARAALRRALALRPLDAAPYRELAHWMMEDAALDAAVAYFCMALRLVPDDAVLYNGLGATLQRAGRTHASRQSLERAVALAPGMREAHSNLGNTFMSLGQHERAEAAYRRALQIDQNYFPAYSNLLFAMSHQAGLSAEALFAEHVRFGERASAAASGSLRKRHANDRDPSRRLRVGLVSGDFRHHAVMNFLEPVLEVLNREQFSLVGYSTFRQEDDVTERVIGLLQEWRQAHSASAVELARLIEDDRIDILFDLSGHTAYNRLPTFAMRPAPIQVSWFGYPATTGLKEMDYYLIDRYVAEPGLLDAQFTEKLVYLPSSGTFKPFPGSPALKEPPALSNGYVTFGSFNRYSKISDVCVATWARVLLAVPGSKMLLGAMTDAQVRASMAERFEAHGVGRDRLLFRPRTDMRQYMEFHNEVDIVLDTFPYTGGTTTNHALWMGVPVLAMQGATRVERQTAGLLGRAGLRDWVCDSPDQYVAQAVSWAGRLDELSALRLGMRQRLRDAPGRSPGTVARGLESAMRTMWRRWCDGLPPESFVVAP